MIILIIEIIVLKIIAMFYFLHLFSIRFTFPSSKKYKLKANRLHQNAQL